MTNEKKEVLDQLNAMTSGFVSIYNLSIKIGRDTQEIPSFHEFIGQMVCLGFTFMRSEDGQLSFTAPETLLQPQKHDSLSEWDKCVDEMKAAQEARKK